MQACKIKELVAGGGLLAWKYHLGAGTAVDDIVRGVLLVQLNTNKVTNNVGRTVSLPGCTRSLTDRTTTSAKCVLICVELYLECRMRNGESNTPHSELVRFLPVLPAEPFDPAFAIDELLLAREERMA